MVIVVGGFTMLCWASLIWLWASNRESERRSSEQAEMRLKDEQRIAHQQSFDLVQASRTRDAERCAKLEQDRLLAEVARDKKAWAEYDKRKGRKAKPRKAAPAWKFPA